jgi:ABC-2 type transport system ATP-binding protein
MTGAETLGLFATLYGVSPSNHHTRITELANAFGLTEHMPRPVASYSGGLRQRLHLAIGLVHEPELLFLDEPTAALDPAGRGLVWELMERHRRRGHTVVVVTHDLAEAAQHCQSIALLHRGKALASGSPLELVAAHATWKLQLELAGGVTEDSPLREKLGSLVGVKKVSVRPRQASLDLTSEEPTAVHRVKDQALSLLVEHKVAVVGFRLQPPDLSSAYFNLTGQALVDSKPRARGEGARGERGRRKPVKEVVP